MELAEYNALMADFKAQTAIQPAKNDPFSMSLFVQYIIASNLSSMSTGFEGAATTLNNINTNLSDIEAKLAELSTKLSNIEKAIKDHV